MEMITFAGFARVVHLASLNSVLLNDLSVDCTREMMMSGIFLRYSS
jgi:hypothetical protein